MIVSADNSSEHASDGGVRFGDYVLDHKRGCLSRDGLEIALRPKTFAVLSYLVDNAGRLIGKDELFSSVWPDIAVTDDALVQSISELRRALGEDSHLIKTMPRRGYRFDGAVRKAVPERPRPTDRANAISVPEEFPAHSASRRAFYALAGLAIIFVAAASWFALLRDDGERRGSRHTSRSITSAKPAIAVLPFVSQGGDAARSYFSDGLTQDLIGALGRFSALTVMSWNAVLPFRGKAAKPGDIARELGVRYQVEGSLRQSGGRVRVAAQLVNSDGQVLWSARFDEALSDIFVLQDKITSQIAAALAVRLSHIEQRRSFSKPTESLEAYDYLLRARPALQRPDRASNAEARNLLRRAIDLDPHYAAAHAALSETFYNAVAMGWAQSPTEFYRRAEELARKALDINDSEVRAHVVLGRIHIFHHRYDQASAAMRRAVAINPNDADALAGLGNVQMWMGETDAAIEAFDMAQHIDPDLHAFDHFALSLARYLKGQYAEAAAQGERTLLRTEGAHFAQAMVAAAYAQLGRDEDARRAAGLLRRKDPAFDPQGFGSKLLRPADIELLREGLRKAGLYPG